MANEEIVPQIVKELSDTSCRQFIRHCPKLELNKKAPYEWRNEGKAELNNEEKSLKIHNI